jgi:hypothetical protein
VSQSRAGAACMAVLGKSCVCNALRQTPRGRGLQAAAVVWDTPSSSVSPSPTPAVVRMRDEQSKRNEPNCEYKHCKMGVVAMTVTSAAANRAMAKTAPAFAAR